MSTKAVKRRKKTKTIVRDEWHGKVKVVEQICLTTGNSRYRHFCRRKICPPELRYKNYNSWDLAVAGAKRLDTDLTKTIERGADPKLIAELELAEEKIRMSGLLKNIGVSILDNSKRRITVLEIVEAGIEFTRAVNEINVIREELGESKYSWSWAARDWVDTYRKNNKTKNRTPFSLEIKNFISHKSGPSGSKSHQKLGKGAIDEWKLHVGTYLQEWCGNEELGANPDALFEIVKKKIIAAVSKNDPNKGESWNMGYRHKCASKISQFGGWLCRNRKISTNPWGQLPVEFPKEEKGFVEHLKPSEVKTLFDAVVKIKNGAMVPYFAMLFYSTCRPEDIADPKVAKERFLWKNFEGWKHKDEETGGYEFLIPKWQEIDGERYRRSKTKDRTALLLPAGAEWIKWHYGKFPVDGQIFWSQRCRREILDEAGIKWIQDIARHTLLSAARHYKEFATQQDDWAWRAGHSRETFREYYSAPVTQLDCEKYFEQIRPPKKHP